ncbi:DNA repair protein RecO [Kocuria sp.]|uniref:DNA repair protein RecO n=1 Tax=Kocuria sp. TaxID=1871328 RepID=UPI0026DFA3A8|nr:DNA repair protein RecO [Kocuria sp.]MDO5617705.1 DNA repair protein RecO [Kocuria sp.]
MPRATSFASKSYRDTGVVLRTYPLGEADRIVVLLTRDHGQVRAVAKGIRRTTSRFGSRLEPFNVSDLQLVHGRNLDIVSQAVGRKGWASPIAADYAKFTAAAAIVEAAENITENDDDESGQHYLLVVGALSALARGLHDPAAILDSYLMRAVSVAGWAPSFTDCARCGEPGPHRAFSAELGGVVCANCRPPGALAPDAATLEYLEALVTGRWEHVDQAPPRVARAAAGLVSSYVQFHLEKTVRALALVERN